MMDWGFPEQLSGASLGGISGRRGAHHDGFRQRVFVVPRKPVLGIFENFRGVLLKLREVVEGIGAREFARMNQAHVEVADVGAVFCFIHEAVFAMEYRFFEGSFGDIVIKRGAGFSEKQGQRLPALQHVTDSIAK